jgi:hypothetical protein
MTTPLFDELAERLAQAHRAVRALEVPAVEKARATRRLLAISDAAKHDLDRAAKRLDAFLLDLAEGRIASDGAPPEQA